MQKVLEGANIKLGDVATDVVGISGRQIMLALVGGQSTAPFWLTWHAANCGPSCHAWNVR